MLFADLYCRLIDFLAATDDNLGMFPRYNKEGKTAAEIYPLSSCILYDHDNCAS
jgi:hypothetical protein